METTPVTPLPQKSGAANKALEGLGSDLNTFLVMLTTQLQNQDPTNPMDTHQMTAQLVQFAAVEQQIAQNKNLETLVGLQTGNAEAAAVSFIGHEVQFESDKITVSPAGTNWDYEFNQSAQSVSLQVLDATGKLVYTEQGQTAPGVRHRFNWGLVDSNGASLTPGDYTLQVVALSSSGNQINSKVISTGQVNGVQTDDETPKLLVGDNIKVALTEVMKVKKTPSQ